MHLFDILYIFLSVCLYLVDFVSFMLKCSLLQFCTCAIFRALHKNTILFDKKIINFVLHLFDILYIFLSVCLYLVDFVSFMLKCSLLQFCTCAIFRALHKNTILFDKKIINFVLHLFDILYIFLSVCLYLVDFVSFMLKCSLLQFCTCAIFRALHKNTILFDKILKFSQRIIFLALFI